MDKCFFKQWGEFLDNKMVHHPVTKISSENFSFYRLVNDKSNRLTRLVATVVNLCLERNQVGFVIDLKCECIAGVTLISTAIKYAS